MRKFSFLCLIFVLTLLITKQTYADDPPQNSAEAQLQVNIVIGGGCFLETQNYESTRTAIKKKVLPYSIEFDPFTIRYKCTPDTQFKVWFNPGGHATVRAYKAQGKYISITPMDTEKTRNVSNRILVQGTGNGEWSEVSVIPVLDFYNIGDTCNCSQNANFCFCEPGTYVATQVPVKIEW